MEYEISKYIPCSAAVEFRSKHSTFKEAWENCHRGDWMLWIAQRLNVNIRTLTYAKAKCGETVMHLMQDERSINAIKVSKRFGRYRADSGELKAAADAAYAYAYAAADAAAYATYAAYAAAADCAAYAAAYAAAAAADDDAADDNGGYAAAYAAYAADAAAYAAAYQDNQDNQLLTANICRRYLTKSVFSKLKIK